MPKKHLLITIGSLIILIFMVLTISYNKKQSNDMSQIYEYISETCNKTIVSIDGTEFQLKVNQPLEISTDLKMKYMIPTSSAKKAILLDVSTIDIGINTTTRHLKPLIVELSYEQGKWLVAKKDLVDVILSKILLQDYEKEYTMIANTTPDMIESIGSYSVNFYYGGSILENVIIRSYDNTLAVKYMLTAKTGDIYEFTKTINN